MSYIGFTEKEYQRVLHQKDPKFKGLKLVMTHTKNKHKETKMEIKEQEKLGMASKLERAYMNDIEKALELLYRQITLDSENTSLVVLASFGLNPVTIFHDVAENFISEKKKLLQQAIDDSQPRLFNEIS